MIYMLRHGLDDETYIGGWSHVSLTNEGIEQVKKTIDFMKKHNICFDKIYSSDIRRALETAQLVSATYQVPIVLNSDLRELDKGLLTGMKKEEAETLYPNYLKNVGVRVRYPKGESLLDLYIRQKKVLEWILELKDALIVTHRGPINMYYFHLNQEPLTNQKTRFGVTHASIHELDSKKKVLKKIYDPKEEK